VQTRPEVLGVQPAALGQSVAESRAAEHLAEQRSLLPGGAPDREHVAEQEVPLRDLRDRRVDRGDRPYHLGERRRA